MARAGRWAPPLLLRTVISDFSRAPPQLKTVIDVSRAPQLQLRTVISDVGC